MKFTLFKSLPIIFCFLLITGCGDSKKDNKSDKITTEVPYEFSKNKAVKDYFSALDEVVNEYVTMIENMAKASNDAKNDEDGGFGAAMNMLGNATGSVLNMAPLLDKMDKLQKEADIMKDDMSQEELKAFMGSYLKLIQRFQEASIKVNGMNKK